MFKSIVILSKAKERYQIPYHRECKPILRFAQDDNDLPGPFSAEHLDFAARAPSSIQTHN